MSNPSSILSSSSYNSNSSSSSSIYSFSKPSQCADKADSRFLNFIKKAETKFSEFSAKASNLSTKLSTNEHIQYAASAKEYPPTIDKNNPFMNFITELEPITRKGRKSSVVDINIQPALQALAEIKLLEKQRSELHIGKLTTQIESLRERLRYENPTSADKKDINSQIKELCNQRKPLRKQADQIRTQIVKILDNAFPKELNTADIFQIPIEQKVVFHELNKKISIYSDIDNNNTAKIKQNMEKSRITSAVPCYHDRHEAQNQLLSFASEHDIKDNLNHGYLHSMMGDVITYTYWGKSLEPLYLAILKHDKADTLLDIFHNSVSLRHNIGAMTKAITAYHNDSSISGEKKSTMCKALNNKMLAILNEAKYLGQEDYNVFNKTISKYS